MRLDKETQQRRKLILEIVDNQLHSPESPEVKKQYDRLRAEGETNANARELIGAILCHYIWHTLREDGYSYADYVAELKRLPDSAFED